MFFHIVYDQQLLPFIIVFKTVILPSYCIPKGLELFKRNMNNRTSTQERDFT